MKPRDSVRLPLPGAEPHPAVILRVEDDWAHVIYGTGTKRELPCVVVPERSRAAIALGFYKTTYFYASNLRQAKLAVLEPRQRTCPPDVFLKLRALVEASLERDADRAAKEE